MSSAVSELQQNSTEHTIVMAIILVFLIILNYSCASESCSKYCDLVLSGHFNAIWRPECKCSFQNQLTGTTFSSQENHANIPKADDMAIYYEPANISETYSLTFTGRPFSITNPTFSQYHLRYMRSNNNNNLLDDSIPQNYKNKKVIRKIEIEVNDLPLYLDIDIQKNTESSSKKNLQHQVNHDIEQEFAKCVDLHILEYSRNNSTKHLQSMWEVNKIERYNNLTNSELKKRLQIFCHRFINMIEESVNKISKSLPRKAKNYVNARYNESVLIIEKNQKYMTSISGDNKSIEYEVVPRNSTTSMDIIFNNSPLDNTKDIPLENTMRVPNAELNTYSPYVDLDNTTERLTVINDTLEHPNLNNYYEKGSFNETDNKTTNSENKILKKIFLFFSEQRITENSNESRFKVDLLSENLSGIILSTAVTNSTHPLKNEENSSTSNFNMYKQTTLFTRLIDTSTLIPTSLEPLLFNFTNSEKIEVGNNKTQSLQLSNTSRSIFNSAEQDLHFRSSKNIMLRINIGKNSSNITTPKEIDYTAETEETVYPELDASEVLETTTKSSQIMESLNSSDWYRFIHKAISKENQHFQDPNRYVTYTTDKNNITPDFSQTNNEFTTSTNEINSPVVYLENHIHIPKIITREYKNDTVVSNIKGSEELPNNDFAYNDADLITETDYTSEVTTKNFINGADKFLHINNQVYGKLILVFNKYHVPVRFVQDSNGRLNLGIDGETLCYKITKDTLSSSLIMSAICNCLRSNTCANTNLKDFISQ